MSSTGRTGHDHKSFHPTISNSYPDILTQLVMVPHMTLCFTNDITGGSIRG